MQNLIIHPTSRATLRSLLREPPHALIITGARGVGKIEAAKAWASRITGTSYQTFVQPNEKGNISIEQIRDLYSATKTTRDQKQVFVIQDAHGMGQDAQNALLKLLEEPREGVIFVLTTDDVSLLLPTIRSRSQATQLLPVPDDNLIEEANNIDPGTLRQMLFIAKGRPRIFSELVADPEQMAYYTDVMQQAKTLMSASKYDRLTTVNKLIKDRAALVDVLEALANMVQVMLVRDASDRWIQMADSLQEVLTAIKQNGNLRAQLTKLFVLY